MDVKKLRNLLSLSLALLLVPVEGTVLIGRALEPAMGPTAAITVNYWSDEGDAYVSDGICDTNGTPSDPYLGICTLRAAIQTANYTAGADTITFDLGVSTIAPDSRLPTITSQVTIIGSGVELDGINASLSGLSLDGPNSTVSGMVINNFSHFGIALGGTGPYTITGNYIGTDPSGVFAKPNGGETTGGGIWVDAPNVTIGGTSPAERNVISGHNRRGITLADDASNCTIIGNYIGVDASGTAALGNSSDGIILFSGGHTIGGTTPGERNVISGNANGIRLSGSDAVSNTIQGNYIGTDKDGLLDLGNTGSGISVGFAENNIIADNLISGNGNGVILSSAAPELATGNIVQGNYIGTTAAGTAALGNDFDGIFGSSAMTNTVIGNLISGNGGHGINLLNSEGNVVRGNIIGANVAGTASLGNALAGVYLSDSDRNVIGGGSGDSLPASCEGYCNLISGNGSGGTWAGVHIDDASGNSVSGNFIGTNAAGTVSLGNYGDGVYSLGLENTIARNLISGNDGDGVSIQGDGYAPINTTTVQANLIGTARDGISNLGNGGHGISVYWSTNNFIGGDQADQGNIIAFNTAAGVAVSADTSGSNRILRNSIHTNGGGSGLGIDLKGDGVTENDSGDGDTGPNKLQNFPVITGLKEDIISGTLNSTPNTAFRLEFFVNSECSSSGHGQGEIFLGSFDVTTDGSGDVAFVGTLDTAPGRQMVTATATDPDGNTSEFSACFGGLVVNSTGDLPDVGSLDDVCNTGQTIANGDPECTLRAAIQQANATPGRDTIIFDIPDWPGAPVIYPTSALPPLIEPVVINGTTQAGGWVRLDGTNAGASVSGLEIMGGDSQVQGLIIGWFDGNGLLLQNAGGNVIVGNLIGITSDDLWVGNGRNGIFIQNSSNNVVGGTAAAERNVIAKNGWRTNASGIYVEMSSTGNVIQGNIIGANSDGNTAAGNTWAGVYIDDVSGNTVGGTAGVSLNECTGACNLISGNKYGVVLKGSQAISNTVQGNFVGTDCTGMVALGNTSYGIVIDGAPNNLIGGTSSAARNLISGNGTAGDEGGGIIIANAAATGNKVQGNTIGTKANGTETLSNAGNGVRVEQAPGNIIGGMDGANVLSGNTSNGVEIVGTAATGNSVQTNLIGTDSSGTAALPNDGSGVLIDGAPNNIVGGADLGNLISGNTGSGVEIAGSGATGNTVQANLIGTNSSSATALPNGGSGVFIDDAPDNTVGGGVAGQGNVLSGNSGSGLKIAGDGADGNVVQGNFIGTDEDGTTALSNGGGGVLLSESASGTQVGGAGEGEGNVISGNDSNGVEIDGLGTANNVVQGNFIGTLKDSVTHVANTAHGVYIAGGASGNTIGGTITPTANTIAFNGGDGVCVAFGNSNAIRRNVIHSNAGLGIDLGTNGVTPNDAGDSDSGANTLQNFPTVTSLIISGGVAAIEGTLDSVAAVTYTLEFFANTGCDASLHGEGERFLGTITVNTDTDGHADFAFTPSTPVSDTEKVTATATDANGNTSEFSRCARPTERVAIDPAIGHTLIFTDTQGNPVIVEVPAGAITYTEPITLAYALIEDEVSGSTGLAFGNRAFELSAYLGNKLLSDLVFSKPITVTIYYSDADVAGLGEEQLTLLYQDDAVWADDGIDVVERNPTDNYVVFTITHLSDFGLFLPQSFEVYLPLILR
jgi:parallel beta-helix repeat protein